jgi:hypothetical protein
MDGPFGASLQSKNNALKRNISRFTFILVNPIVVLCPLFQQLLAEQATLKEFL